MHYLIIVSIIWAFSFGLIGNTLSDVDPFFVAATRLGIASLIFLPFVRLSALPTSCTLRLMACGGLQFGMMYVFYIQAFRYIPSHLVALFSILTPVYVVFVYNLKRGRLHWRFFWAAILSVAGAAIIQFQASNSEFVWKGFALMQLAGFSFGFGQVEYREWKRSHSKIKDHQVFALLFLGGFIVASSASTFFTDWSRIHLNTDQIKALAYLSIVASGAGFFFWNKGASISKPGTLAAFNNAVIPLAVVCSLLIFDEISKVGGIELIRLLSGSVFIILAIYLSEQPKRNISSNANNIH